MQAVRIIEIPPCKMVSSGRGFFGEENFTKFNAWFSSLPRSMHSKDFLYWTARVSAGSISMKRGSIP